MFPDWLTSRVSRADLKMYKNNMWGLLGLLQCLEKAGDPEVRFPRIGQMTNY